MSLWDGDDGERFIIVSQNSKSFCQMIIMIIIIITMIITMIMMIMIMGEMTRSGSHPDNAGEHKMVMVMVMVLTLTMQVSTRASIFRVSGCLR